MICTQAKYNVRLSFTRNLTRPSVSKFVFAREFARNKKLPTLSLTLAYWNEYNIFNVTCDWLSRVQWGKRVQIEKVRNEDWTWADKDEKQLGEDSESIQSTFYTTDNCSMSKVQSISVMVTTTICLT